MPRWSRPSSTFSGRNKRFPAPLRISASDGFAEGYLAPVLADFSRSMDDLTIELIADNQFADLARREADIAVRPPDQKRPARA